MSTYSNQLLFDVAPVMPQSYQPAEPVVKSFFVGEVDIVYRKKQKIEGCRRVTGSHDIAPILRQLFPESMTMKEHFFVLFLDRNNNINGYSHVSSGGLTGTVADPRIIYMEALKTQCVALILAHNHPSGSLKPSQADQDLTRKIKEAGRFLDMQVLDHIILGEDDMYYSFADEGIL